jgi:hypothetical protein
MFCAKPDEGRLPYFYKLVSEQIDPLEIYHPGHSIACMVKSGRQRCVYLQWSKHGRYVRSASGAEILVHMKQLMDHGVSSFLCP